MNKIIAYPTEKSIAREACALIARLDGNEHPSREDLDALREWMGRSPAHRQEILKLVEVWESFHLLAQLPTPQARHSPGWIKDLLSELMGKPFFKPAFGSLALLIVTVMMFAFSGLEKTSYSTAVGEQRRFVLGDGSSVLLNTASAISVRFDNETRSVVLKKGEAHFEVQHDRSRPFVVRAQDNLVTAVGTAFSMRLIGQDLRLSVTEGRVKLSPVAKISSRAYAAVTDSGAANPVTLVDAGTSVLMGDRIKEIVEPTPEELARELAWQKGMLVFDNQKLGDVVVEVARYTDQTINFADPSIKEMRIGGQFRVGQTDALFLAMHEALGLTVEDVGGSVRISRASELR